MNDLYNRLEISCARCGAKGKPTSRATVMDMKDYLTGETIGAAVILNQPPDWTWVEGRVVCNWCGAILKDTMRTFWGHK